MPVFSTKIFLFALACASLALVVAQSCPAGQEFVDNACQDCPPGEFKNAPGEGACAPCPAGSFTSVSGSTTAAVAAPGSMPTQRVLLPASLVEAGLRPQLGNRVRSMWHGRGHCDRFLLDRWKNMSCYYR
ncbi:hypothetical protein ONZ45_g16627 [Pleurotus djamor]|nr:hypothetical protein ONZ45_g16627 [Pleurotus djamor]